MIHRFRVTNFKSLYDVSVELSPITVLVGKSGTGKSNFVESLRTLREVISQSNLRAQIAKWPGYRPATARESATRFEIEFSILGVAERFSYELEIAPQGPASPVHDEALRLGDKLLFSQAKGKWKTEPELTQIPQAGPLAIGRIPSISNVVIAYTALSKGIGCYDFSDNVLTSSQTAGQGAGLDDHASNYLTVFNEITSNLRDLRVKQNIVSALRQINSSVSSVELNDIQQPQHIIVGHDFKGKTLNLGLNQESVGFRRFYAYLLALYQIPPKLTLIFEHPEDGVYPGALSLLAEEFRSAPHSDRGQVILTTHSPDLLNNFEGDEIRVVDKRGFGSRIGPVSQEQRTSIEEDLYEAGDLLNVDPARLDEQEPESPAS